MTMSRTNRTAAAARRAAPALMLSLAVCLGAAACGGSGATGATDSTTLIQVVAAESVWGEIATQIGGPQVQVTDITGGSAGVSVDPAAYRPSPADTKAVAGAQVLIVNGAGLDPWAGQAAAADPGIGRLDVNVGDVVGVTPGGDPYLWYEPAYVRSAAEQIETDFAQLRPADAAYFRQQEQAFEASSSATDEALAGTIKSRFGGVQVGACPGLAADVAGGLGLKPDDAVTSAQITDKQVKVLLCDAQASDAASRGLLSAAGSAHIPVVALSENLEPAGTTFQAWLTAQLQQIDQAMAHS
jgi:zinc/manganese transport system substrate-binding protein